MGGRGVLLVGVVGRRLYGLEEAHLVANARDHLLLAQLVDRVVVDLARDRLCNTQMVQQGI